MVNWQQWLQSAAANYIRKVETSVGKEGEEQAVHRYVLSRKCPEEVRSAIRLTAIREAPRSVEEVLAAKPDSDTYRMFDQFLDREDLYEIVALHHLTHLLVNDVAAFPEAWRDLEMTYPQQTTGLRLACRTRQDVFDAVQKLDVDVMFSSVATLPLLSMYHDDNERYFAVREQVAEVAGVEPEVVDWWCVDDTIPLPARIHEEIAERAVRILQAYFLMWHAQYEELREWTRQWWTETSDEDIDLEFKSLKGKAYNKRLSMAVVATNLKREKAIHHEDAKRYWHSVIRDNNGVDHILAKHEYEPGDNGPEQRPVHIDARLVRKESAKRLREAPDQAVMVFYQLHHLVFVPGNQPVLEMDGEQKLLNLITRYGTPGVLRRTKAGKFDKGEITFWGAHDEALFRQALKKMTEKALTSGAGEWPAVTYGHAPL